MTDLIEDDDGAPLPPELQRDGAVWMAAYTWMTDPHIPVTGRDVEQWPKRTTDDLMGALAPALWPWLPQNDESAAGKHKAEMLAARGRVAIWAAKYSSNPAIRAQLLAAFDGE